MISEKLKSEISLTAAIITIINAAWALIGGFFNPDSSSAEIIQFFYLFESADDPNQFLNKLVWVIVLETCIAFSFGFLLAIICGARRQFIAPAYIVVCALSAWISFFNIYVFLYSGELVGAWEFIGFLVGSVAACALAVYTMEYHIMDAIQDCKANEKERGLWSLRFGQLTQTMLFGLFILMVIPQ